MRYFNLKMTEAEIRSVFAKYSQELHPDKIKDNKFFEEMYLDVKQEYDDIRVLKKHELYLEKYYKQYFSNALEKEKTTSEKVIDFAIQKLSQENFLSELKSLFEMLQTKK